jgi:carbon dioxide concentrating mechanism protein CcmN
LINDAHFFVSGNVTIHPTAVIAPGVLLQADPGCQLVVGAGTCVGIGSILHAHQGNLVIEAGVTLGSGVLIVGNVTIGTNACIGSTTTILNRSIEPQQLVAAGSLLGDESRQIDLTQIHSPQPVADAPVAAEPSPANGSSPPASPEMTSPVMQVVYGRTYLERMMVTMFPHRQAIEPPPMPPAAESPPDPASGS